MGHAEGVIMRVNDLYSHLDSRESKPFPLPRVWYHGTDEDFDELIIENWEAKLAGNVI